MGKVIKVIDLFNMKANKEKMPKHIRINESEYFYDENRKTYDNEYNEQMSFDFTDNVLNMEVEILDEEDEVDIQSIEGINEHYFSKVGDLANPWTNKEEMIIKKQNTILEALKQLDKEIKELKEK